MKLPANFHDHEGCEHCEHQNVGDHCRCAHGVAFACGEAFEAGKAIESPPVTAPASVSIGSSRASKPSDPMDKFGVAKFLHDVVGFGRIDLEDLLQREGRRQRLAQAGEKQAHTDGEEHISFAKQQQQGRHALQGKTLDQCCADRQDECRGDDDDVVHAASDELF